ncbi:MAG: phosphate transport system regulatory protein PhoU, partial [Bacteroidia bacterium]|nr:phosphate transport system regulatory protein PhoU [Bacteroidia bacterium]
MEEPVTHLDIELQTLKNDLNDMFGLVVKQLDKAKRALIDIDKDLAHEVRANEKRVNGFELKIDRDCEGIIALYKPVAVDLRLVLAALKINMNLERIGDIADGIAQFVVQIEQNQEKLEPSDELLK